MSSGVLPELNPYHHDYAMAKCEIRAVITNPQRHPAIYRHNIALQGISGGAHLSDQVPLMRLEWQI
jgi:hypothetical protein